MDTPTSNKHTYILDPESPTEMARLIHFDQVVTRAMRGPLAEQTPAAIASMQRLLDLACGPDGWVLDVAYDNPHKDKTHNIRDKRKGLSLREKRIFVFSLIV